MRRATCAVALALSLTSCGAEDPGGSSTERRGFTPGGGGGPGPGGGSGTAGSLGGGFDSPTGGAPMQSGGSMAFDPMSGMSCADASVHTSKAEPEILFVLDGSGSMCAPFGGATRWSAVRGALLGQMDGLIYRLQQTVHFGMLIYDGTIDPLVLLLSTESSPSPACAGMYLGAKAMGECPGLAQVPVALNNAMAIDTAFPQTELGGSTPTDKAMKLAVDQMIAMKNSDPDAKPRPQYIILATDGQPNDICVAGMGGDGSLQKNNVLAEIDRAAMANITTFVISLADGDPGLQAHLDDAAKRGEPGNPMAHTFNPMTPEDLTNTLIAIIGGAVGCEITLNGAVTVGSECRGFVKLGGMPAPCCQVGAGGAVCDGQNVDPPNGWRLKDASTIELLGQTCEAFLASPDLLLEAGFPCDVFEVL
jgi:hypothetical protein